MPDNRLSTELWVSAHLRRLSANGTGAYLLRRGDAERGSVIVRLATSDGTKILTQIRDLDGNLAWMPAQDGKTMKPEDADAYVQRAIDRDSDLWVVEIESRDGMNPFEERLLGL